MRQKPETKKKIVFDFTVMLFYLKLINYLLYTKITVIMKTQVQSVKTK